MRASLIARSFEAMAPVDTITKYPRLFRHKLGTVVIPEDLRARLSGALKNYPRASLVQNAKVLAEVLRQRVRARPSDASAGVIKPRVMLRYDRDETFTYLAHRVPGIYATAFRVFREAAFKLPTFAPESVLDYGSGPGTALMAARVVWPAMQKAVAIEPSSEMESAAVKLMADMEGLTVERRRYLIKDVEKQHELVIASYSLGEVQDPIERTEVVKLLWSLVADDGGVLVLIEPGTPVGFKTINDARTLVLQRKANLIAPCPHAHACPMPNTSWCHFKQRIRKANNMFLLCFEIILPPQTPLQMQTKLNKSVNFSDEKYSYLVAAKAPFSDTNMVVADMERHRVLKQPMKKGGHVVIDTCSQKGEYAQITVARSHGSDVYRSARKAYAGDEIFVSSDPKAAAAAEKRQKKSEFAAGESEQQAIEEAEENDDDEDFEFEEEEIVAAVKAAPAKVAKAAGGKAKKNNAAPAGLVEHMGGKAKKSAGEKRAPRAALPKARDVEELEEDDYFDIDDDEDGEDFGEELDEEALKAASAQLAAQMGGGKAKKVAATAPKKRAVASPKPKSGARGKRTKD
jgi:ribosomal protein RSM22 (predicted rRNA methylase)